MNALLIFQLIMIVIAVAMMFLGDDKARSRKDVGK